MPRLLGHLVVCSALALVVAATNPRERPRPSARTPRRALQAVSLNVADYGVPGAALV